MQKAGTSARVGLFEEDHCALNLCPIGKDLSGCIFPENSHKAGSSTEMID